MFSLHFSISIEAVGFVGGSSIIHIYWMQNLIKQYVLIHLYILSFCEVVYNVGFLLDVA